MRLSTLSGISVAISIVPSVIGHATVWHPSMFGFNYTGHNNPPFFPLQQRNFGGEQGWWGHGHIEFPPNKGDLLEFPAGGETFVELTCDKAATSFYKTGTGTDLRDGNKVCPGSGPLEYHTNGLDDVKGCAFAIAYTPATQVKSIQPEDFVVFSINQTCVWERFTKFQVPADMPACPEGGCTCAWNWIHSADAGAEQIYLNFYACDITGAKSTTPLAKPQVPRRCGAITDNKQINKNADAGNCTYGAKTPMYWFQNERNNMFEGSHAPPYYNDLYNFKDGAQNDIFQNSKLPKMNWHGSPISGNLAAVRGSFPSGGGNSNVKQNAQPSDTNNNDNNNDDNKNDTPSSSSGGSPPAPSPTQKGDTPTNAGADPSRPPKKLCKKNNGGNNKKRSIMDALSRHKRQSVVRRHH